MAENHELLQIGEFARLAETNLRTLRYYEELELLKPASRSQGGFRHYKRHQLDRMAAIKRLQELGLSLKEISKALATNGPASGPNLVSRLRPALEAQITMTERKMEAIRSHLAELQSSRARLVELCQHCDTDFSIENCDPCPRDRVPLPAVLRALL